VLQGDSEHSKHSFTPFTCAYVAMAQNLFGWGVHPSFQCGHVPLTILGHISHAIPQTPTFTIQPYWDNHMPEYDTSYW